jgi:hypothetical protein
MSDSQKQNPGKSSNKYALAGVRAEFHELFFEQPKAIESLSCLRGRS